MIRRPEEGMTLIVKTVTRLTVGLILIFGIYIVLHGHLTPGGGFAGGVIIALSFIHLMLAFGSKLALKKMSKSVASYFESIGATLFVTIAFLGFLTGVFFTNFLHTPGMELYRISSSGSILLSNIAISLKVGAGLFAGVRCPRGAETKSGRQRMIIYMMCLALFCVGVYCMLVKRNLIKIIIGVGIAEYAVNLFLILVAYKANGRAPIMDKHQTIRDMVDPLPQALVLTSIVIGLAVVALMVVLAVRIYEKYGTFDITEIRRLKG